MAWTLGQWNQELTPSRQNGQPLSADTGWKPIQAGVTNVRVRLDLTNDGLFTNPFDRHPFNSPSMQIEYLLEVSPDGVNSWFVAGGTSVGSANGRWPTRNDPNRSWIEASADIPHPDGNYPSFYRASYTANAAIAFGVSVLPS
jgi:hypothetical protein